MLSIPQRISRLTILDLVTVSDLPAKRQRENDRYDRDKWEGFD